VLRFTYIFSRCCLQRASVLQVGIVFQAVNWLLFYIPEQKGSSRCDKTHIHNNPEYEASAHFTHINYFGIIAQQCIIYYSVGFPSGKELALLEVCNQL
jgi:hypothetical protein